MGLELTTIQSKFIRCHQPPAEWFPVDHLNHSCHSCFCGNTWASWKARASQGQGESAFTAGIESIWSNCKVQSVLEGWTGQNNTGLERRVALTLGFARNMRIFGKESFTASNKLANCSKLKSGTSHSVCFLSQHLGLLTSSAAKHPEILAIRYQLNLMELARKPKPRRQHRGQPCTNNTYNISRESRMTSSRLHGQRTFRPNLMTSVELVSLVCSTLTMHCDCVQYQQGAADFNP